MTEPRLRWPTVVGWSFYDLASNFYAFVVLTAYFPTWFTDKEFGFGGRALDLGIANAVAMAGMILAFPILGVLTDRYRRRVPLVFVFTILCVAPVAMLGSVSNLYWVLGLFALARLGYQGAFVFYGSMLPDVAASPRREGRVSGLGTAAGYVGTLLAILVMRQILNVGDENAYQAFLPSALLYAAFSIPFFLLVRDTAPVHMPMRAYARAAPEAMATFLRTLRDATRYRAPFLFLLASFFLLDAVQTVIHFMGTYMRDVVGMPQSERNFFYFLGTSTAVFGSLGIGWIGDRIGLARTLSGLFLTWVGVFVLAAMVQKAWMLWIVSPAIGICLGATWTCGRPYLMQLAPPEKRTEFFSLFGLIDRLSVAIGPLIWGLILYFSEKRGIDLKTANRFAISSLAVMALIGWVLLPIKRRTSPDLRASNP